MKLDVSQNREVSDRGATSALTVWNRIVGELAGLQDASTSAPGAVVNPVYGSPSATALLSHIAADLLTERGSAPPCIAPSEGPAVVANVLPMFEQSVAWKGRLLAELILEL